MSDETGKFLTEASSVEPVEPVTNTEEVVTEETTVTETQE